MKNNKLALFPGLSLFVCFCLLRGAEGLVDKSGGASWLYALAEALAFILPALLSAISVRDQKTLYRRLRFKKLPHGALFFSIKLGAAAAAASVLADMATAHVEQVQVMLQVTPMYIPLNPLQPIEKFLVLVILPAFVEEMFIRGSLMVSHEQMACTMGCILASGAAFALLYGDVSHLAGPFIMGMAYAYLVYSFDSVWPAILAHMAGSLYYLGAAWLTQTYAAFDIWSYFTAINALILLFLLLTALRSAENLLLEELIPDFERGAGLYDMLLLMRNPGVAAFVIAFIAKAVLHWI